MNDVNTAFSELVAASRTRDPETALAAWSKKWKPIIAAASNDGDDGDPWEMVRENAAILLSIYRLPL
jgi:aminoglycoside N3'-acetyltransferase